MGEAHLKPEIPTFARSILSPHIVADAIEGCWLDTDIFASLSNEK
jgi:hypothetical protein